MLIEQIIEFEVRGPGLLAVHVFLQLVILMTKQKYITKVFNRIILLFTSKILKKAMHLTCPYMGQITSKFYSKFKISNVFWT